MTDQKNPYNQDTPEWQLFENMVSAGRAADTFAADAARYTIKSQQLRTKEEMFRAALDKLKA